MAEYGVKNDTTLDYMINNFASTVQSKQKITSDAQFYTTDKGKKMKELIS